MRKQKGWPPVSHTMEEVWAIKKALSEKLMKMSVEEQVAFLNFPIDGMDEGFEAKSVGNESDCRKPSSAPPEDARHVASQKRSEVI